MGTITISVADETETQFRDVVEQEMGTAKGSLGRAVEEALDMWIGKKREETVAQRQLELMRRGFPMGKCKVKREELHERWN